MAFTADELVNINNSTLEHFIDKGRVWKQFVANKPMLEAFNSRAGFFPGGKEFVSWGVKAGQGGGGVQGYTGDDQLSFYNPTGVKRARAAWKEHHIGTVITHTELKIDGVDVIESGANARTSEMGGREEFVLANLLDEKNDTMGEDFARSMDLLLHGDGSTDTKAFAGIKSIILHNPGAGSTFGLSRPANVWWRNDAATNAFGLAGGRGRITSNPANGGALIEAMDQAMRRRMKYAQGATRTMYFAGTDFIDAYKREIRANGNYFDNGVNGRTFDGAMTDPSHGGVALRWDPTLDDIGESKFCYAIDMGQTGLRMMYMDGQRMKRHNPARPYDRMVMYNGITTTCVLIAKQLNTSGVYEIA